MAYHGVIAVITCTFQGYLLRMRQVVEVNVNALSFLNPVPMGSVIDEKKVVVVSKIVWVQTNPQYFQDRRCGLFQDNQRSTS
jgi:hypothetical protein